MSGFISNATRTIYLGGNEITRFVTAIPASPTVVSAWGALPDLPPLEIQCRNDNFAFTKAHPVSLLYGRRLATQSVEVKRAGLTLWKGFLTDAKTDAGRRAATLLADSPSAQKINAAARVDTTTTSPADAASRLLKLHNVPIDEASFARAAAILDDIPVEIKVAPSVFDWAGTLGDLLQLIATAGLLRFYLTPSGAIGCDSWAGDDSPTSSLTLTDADLMAMPGTESEESDPFEGYSVQYLYGTEVDGEGERLQSLDFSANSAVQVTTAAGAAYIGSQWVALSRRVYTRVTAPIRKELGPIVRLGSYVTLDSDRLAISRTAEVVGIDDGDKKHTVLTLKIDEGVA